MIWEDKLCNSTDRHLVLEEPAPSILKVEAAGSFRTLVPVCQTAWCYAQVMSQTIFVEVKNAVWSLAILFSKL